MKVEDILEGANEINKIAKEYNNKKDEYLGELYDECVRRIGEELDKHNKSSNIVTYEIEYHDTKIDETYYAHVFYNNDNSIRISKITKRIDDTGMVGKVLDTGDFKSHWMFRPLMVLANDDTKLIVKDSNVS